MKGKDIIVIGALAAGAYLLLGGSGGSGGGTEGGGGKKATVLTGAIGTPSVVDPWSSPQQPQQTYQEQQQQSTLPFASFLGLIPESFSMTGNNYEGIRNVGSSTYRVEGDFMPSKKMELNSNTGQLLTRDTGGIGAEVLYTEKSQKIASVPGISRITNSSGQGYSYGGGGSSWGSPGNTTKKSGGGGSAPSTYSSSSSSSSGAFSSSAAKSRVRGW